MDKRPIAFYDSGIGGLPYLCWARDRLPGERFVYVADDAHFPYGEKSPEELRPIVVATVGRMLSRLQPKLVVVACNTATVVALAALRSSYSVPFVGVVPAVKPAAERSNGRKFALLATTRTVGDAYSERLIREYASDCTVVRVAGQPLVSFIEEEYLDASPDRLREAMDSAVAPLAGEQVDSLILGCTHFTFLDREFRERLGDGVEVIDSREGVGKQVMRLLRRQGIEASPRAGAAVPPDARLFHTGAGGERYTRYASRFGLEYVGALG